MKNFPIVVLAILAIVYGCKEKASESTDGQSDTMEMDVVDTMAFQAGDSFAIESPISLAQMMEEMKADPEKEFVVSGNIASVCQMKGCWMELALPDSQEMHVTFKDYGFFVPKDASGKTVIMKGIPSVDTISVSHLQHLAKDAKKSEEEIAAITEPEIQLTFEASGVVIK